MRGKFSKGNVSLPYVQKDVFLDFFPSVLLVACRCFSYFSLRGKFSRKHRVLPREGKRYVYTYIKVSLPSGQRGKESRAGLRPTFTFPCR